jgi:hypothetical protein
VQAVAVIGDSCTGDDPCSVEGKRRLKGEL